MGGHFSNTKLSLPLGRLGPPSNTWYLGPTWVTTPHGISINSAVLQGSQMWPTDRASKWVKYQSCYSVHRNRLDVMQPNNDDAKTDVTPAILSRKFIVQQNRKCDIMCHANPFPNKTLLYSVQLCHENAVNVDWSILVLHDKVAVCNCILQLCCAIKLQVWHQSNGDDYNDAMEKKPTCFIFSWPTNRLLRGKNGTPTALCHHSPVPIKLSKDLLNIEYALKYTVRHLPFLLTSSSCRAISCPMSFDKRVISLSLTVNLRSRLKRYSPW